MKQSCALLAMLLALCLLAGCGASGVNEAKTASAGQEIQDTAGLDGGADLVKKDDSQKIIYRAWLEIESKEYLTAREALLKAADAAGGYLESSSENGEEGNRRMNMVLRIPTDQYETFLETAGEAGNLLSRRQEQENVTAQYVDLEARLESLETQRTRLQELLAQAEKLEDVLTIQQQLSDTEYQIESYTAQMRALSNQVDYCTVEILLCEVQDLTLARPNFFQRIGGAFADGWASFGRMLQELTIGVVYLLPVILTACVVALVIAAAVRRSRRRTQRRPNMPPSPPPTYDPPRKPDL